MSLNFDRSMARVVSISVILIDSFNLTAATAVLWMAARWNDAPMMSSLMSGRTPSCMATRPPVWIFSRPRFTDWKRVSPPVCKVMGKLNLCFADKLVHVCMSSSGKTSMIFICEEYRIKALSV